MMYPEEEDFDDPDIFEEVDIEGQQNEKPAPVQVLAKSASRPPSAKSSSENQGSKHEEKDKKCSLIKVYTMLVGLFMVSEDEDPVTPTTLCFSRSWCQLQLMIPFSLKTIFSPSSTSS